MTLPARSVTRIEKNGWQEGANVDAKDVQPVRKRKAKTLNCVLK